MKDILHDRRFVAILRLFPERVAEALSKIGASESREITEIRLRGDRPLCVTIMGKSRIVTPSGRVTEFADNPFVVSREEVRKVFEAACENSVYAHQHNVASGFVTVAGGCRVGIAGTAVVSQIGTVTGLRDIGSLNIRIGREVRGVSKVLMEEAVEGGRPLNMLIASPPNCGKTTMLRDMCRELSLRGYRVAVIDERFELSGLTDGIPSFDMGINCDVLGGIGKAVGLTYASRNLAPDVIICDEVATADEVEAVALAVGSGSAVLASVHAGSVAELVGRGVVRPLLERGVMDKAVILDRSPNLGRIIEIADLRDGSVKDLRSEPRSVVFGGGGSEKLREDPVSGGTAGARGKDGRVYVRGNAVSP